MKRGFTLVEILIVISVIVILTAISVTAYTVTEKQAADDKRKTDIAVIEAALTNYLKDNNEYPAAQIDNTIDGPGMIDFYQKYVRNTVKDPSDNFTTYPDWRYTSGGVPTPFCWNGRERTRPTTRCQGYGYFSTRSTQTSSWSTSPFSGTGCTLSTSNLTGSSWYILTWYSATDNRIYMKKKVAYGNPTITLQESGTFATVKAESYPTQTCTFID